MLDETSIKIASANLTVASATATRDQLATDKGVAGTTEAGYNVEVDQAVGSHQNLATGRSRRAADGVREMAGHVANHLKSGSKSSIAEAGAARVRIAAEDAFLGDVLKASQGRIDAARERLRLAEIVTLRSHIAFLEADCILMAVQHRDAAKHLLELDSSLEEVPYGPRIVEALDLIARLTVSLNQKERGN